jgi:hypothetical protein
MAGKRGFCYIADLTAKAQSLGFANYKEALWGLYLKHQTVTPIARTFKLCTATVYRHMKVYGLARRARGGLANPVHAIQGMTHKCGTNLWYVRSGRCVRCKTLTNQRAEAARKLRRKLWLEAKNEERKKK